MPTDTHDAASRVWDRGCQAQLTLLEVEQLSKGNEKAGLLRQHLFSFLERTTALESVGSTAGSLTFAFNGTAPSSHFCCGKHHRLHAKRIVFRMGKYVRVQIDVGLLPADWQLI